MNTYLEPKIFCIGRNKTGTTSLEKLFKDLGYKVGNQHQAELLSIEYLKGNTQTFHKLIEYCKTSQVFQDIPFSCPETYKHLDNAFPNSKFILTIRDSAQQWYESISRFHAKLFGNGLIPKKEDLINANYLFKGYAWIIHRALYDTPEDDLYNKQILMDHYLKYNQDVIEYFKGRTNDLLVINLSEKNDFQRLCEFLGIQTSYTDFPWENKTKGIETSVNVDISSYSDKIMNAEIQDIKLLCKSLDDNTDSNEIETELLKKLTNKLIKDSVFFNIINNNVVNKVRVLQFLGILCFENKIYERVLPFFHQAYVLDNNNKDTLYNLGYVLCYYGEKKIALDYLRRIKDPDSEVKELIDFIQIGLTTHS